MNEELYTKLKMEDNCQRALFSLMEEYNRPVSRVIVTGLLKWFLRKIKKC